MSVLLSLFTQVLHIGLMLAAAPTAVGFGAWLAARLSGHTGPPILLPWHDLTRLTRKTPMPATALSIVSSLAPAVGLGAALSAAALVPSFTLGMVLSPLADVLVVVSLLTVARVATVLAALDSGAALPALDAQTTSASAVLAEPALMLALIALALMGGSANLDQIIGQQRDGPLLPAAALAVVLTALLALAYADAATPADGLDQMFSGRVLAIDRITRWLRRLVWFDLLGGLFLPIGMATTDNGPLDWALGMACWSVKLLALVVVLAGIQTLLGRLPRRNLTDLVGIAALLALLAFVMIIASAGGA